MYWSSRFDEWVEPFRVVEPNENNIIVQVGFIVTLKYILRHISTLCSHFSFYHNS